MRANRRKAGVHVDVALELENGILGLQTGAISAECTLGNPPPNAQGSPFWASMRSRTASHRSDSANCFPFERPLKDFLLEPGDIAGIGISIPANRCGAPGSDPRRRRILARRSGAGCTKHLSVLSVLRMLFAPGAKLSRSDWWFQGLEPFFAAYDRMENHCRRCGNRSVALRKAAVPLTIAPIVRNNRL